MFGLGTTELIIILVIIMILFGAGRLPEIGSGLGRGIRNFKRATRGEDDIDVTATENGADSNGSLEQPKASKVVEAEATKETVES